MCSSQKTGEQVKTERGNRFLDLFARKFHFQNNSTDIHEMLHGHVGRNQLGFYQFKVISVEATSTFINYLYKQLVIQNTNGLHNMKPSLNI
jgi:hypothetical protein